MRIFSFFCVLVVLAIVSHVQKTNAQQSYLPEEEPPAETISLTKENIDALLMILSPVCRTEIEAALGSQATISADCKDELQRALPQLGANPPPVGEEGASTSGQQQQQQPPRSRRQQRASAGGSDSTSKSTPTPSAGTFTLFGTTFLSLVLVLLYHALIH